MKTTSTYETFDIVGKLNGKAYYRDFDTVEEAIKFRKNTKNPEKLKVVCREIYNYFEHGEWVGREEYVNPIDEAEYWTEEDMEAEWQNNH